MDVFVGIKIWTWTKSKQKEDKSGLAFKFQSSTNFNQKSKFIRKTSHARVKSISLLILDRIQLHNSIPPLTEYQYTCFYKGSGSNFGGIFLLKIKKEIFTVFTSFSSNLQSLPNVLGRSSIWKCRISNICFDFFNCACL